MSVDLLITQRILTGVPKEKLQALYEMGNDMVLEADQTVIQEGQDPTSIYFILLGEVDVILPDAEKVDLEKRVNTLAAGECIGEYGFVDGRPASATVRTTTHTRLFEIPVPVLRECLKQDPDLQRIVYENLLHSLVEKLRTNNIIIDFLHYRD